MLNWTPLNTSHFLKPFVQPYLCYILLELVRFFDSIVFNMQYLWQVLLWCYLFSHRLVFCLVLHLSSWVLLLLFCCFLLGMLLPSAVHTLFLCVLCLKSWNMKIVSHILSNPCSYEAVFYSAFSMVLIGWIFVESANLYCSEESGSARRRSLVDGSVFGYEERHLQLSDLRIPLLFVSLVVTICLADWSI